MCWDSGSHEIDKSMVSDLEWRPYFISFSFATFCGEVILGLFICCRLRIMGVIKEAACPPFIRLGRSCEWLQWLSTSDRNWEHVLVYTSVWLDFNLGYLLWIFVTICKCMRSDHGFRSTKYQHSSRYLIEEGRFIFFKIWCEMWEVH